MRLIDADALIADCELAQKQADRHGREFANAFYSGGGDISTEWWCVEDMIENAPTVEERKKGMWKEITEGDCSGYDPTLAGYDDPVVGYVCSCCGYGYEKEVTGDTLYNYCPNCGADMRGERDETN